MHRIDHATLSADENGSGKDGFTEGTPGTVAATVVTDAWLNDVQEEISNTIEAAGITLSKGTQDQLLDAIKAFALMDTIPISSGFSSNSSGVAEWYFNTDRITSRVNTGAKLFGVPLLKGVSQTVTITVWCAPGAARGSGNRVTAKLFYLTDDGVGRTSVNSAEDDGTTSNQDIVLSSGSITPAANDTYYLEILAGNTGAASPDDVYNIKVSYAF